MPSYSEWCIAECSSSSQSGLVVNLTTSVLLKSGGWNETIALPLSNKPDGRWAINSGTGNRRACRCRSYGFSMMNGDDLCQRLTGQEGLEQGLEVVLVRLEESTWLQCRFGSNNDPNTALDVLLAAVQDCKA